MKAANRAPKTDGLLSVAHNLTVVKELPFGSSLFPHTPRGNIDSDDAKGRSRHPPQAPRAKQKILEISKKQTVCFFAVAVFGQATEACANASKRVAEARLRTLSAVLEDVWRRRNQASRGGGLEPRAKRKILESLEI